ncbi:MAG TPA: DUF2079 domain-containing protein, partial [Anaerolineae bacterium]|nr:DUF2079 domain-containing protein [Anaerolineae bacterium]
PLVYTHMGVPLSRLAEHVEIVYFLLVPVYALWPSPETLLILQALLYTLGALPVYVLARRRLGSSWLALLLAVVYLFYPVGQTAVLFEFHADTLAAPLLMFAIEAADRRHWQSYWIWLFLALASKFYVSVPVTMMGLLFWRRGERRMGRWTVAAGIGWFFFSFGLVRALFAPAQDAANLKATPGSYFDFYFGQISALRQSALPRLLNAVVVYSPALFLGIFAWEWLIVASSTIVPVLLSSGIGPSYSYIFHHYVLAVPFLVTAVIYGAETRRKWEAPVPKKRLFPWQSWVVLTVLVTLALNFMFVNLPRDPAYYLSAGREGQAANVYRITERDVLKSDWLAEVVPDEAAVAADRLLGVHLINRKEFYLTRPLKKPLADLLPALDYVVVDALFDYDITPADQVDNGGVDWDWEPIVLLMQSPGWQLQQARDGLLLFGREGDGLAQAVAVETAVPDPPLLAQFEDAIGLVGCDAAEVVRDKMQMTCEWVALRPLAQDPQYFAVTRIEGVANGRIVHLPTLALYPTQEWEEGQLIRETFEFTLPEDMAPGQYALYTGWYDSSHPQAFATDAASRLGREYQTGSIVIAP